MLKKCYPLLHLYQSTTIKDLTPRIQDLKEVKAAKPAPFCQRTGGAQLRPNKINILEKIFLYREWAADETFTKTVMYSRITPGKVL